MGAELKSLVNRARAFARWLLRRGQAWQVAYQRRLLPGAHYLAVCAIFKDEARFLREWVTFHRGVGVTHFFLYNNNSSDNFRTVLAEFDCVTLVDWPSTDMAQRGAYLDCVRRFGGQARWIAFIDIDEFLFAPSAASVAQVMRRFESRPAVLASGGLFGTNGVAQIPERVIPTFTRRAADYRGSKSVVDPRQVRDVRNAHVFTYYSLRPYANPPVDVLRTNHYWARSIEEIEIKCRRGDVWGDTPKFWRDPAYLREYDSILHEVDDWAILPIARAIFGSSVG